MPTYPYPQVFWAISMALIDSINRVNPDHIALGPGGESFFLARYPPNLASIKTAVLIFGMFSGGGVFSTNIQRYSYSFFSKIKSQVPPEPFYTMS